MRSEFPDVVSKTVRFVLKSKQTTFNLGKLVTNLKGNLSHADDGERAVSLLLSACPSSAGEGYHGRASV